MKAACLATAFAIALTVAPTANTAWSAQLDAAPAFGPEFSDVRKKVRRAPSVDSRSPYYLRPGVAPSFGFVGPPGYAGEYAWRRSIGQCVEDLGYGRWAACGNR
jgi:hypothetical protein